MIKAFSSLDSSVQQASCKLPHTSCRDKSRLEHSALPLTQGIRLGNCEYDIDLAVRRQVTVGGEGIDWHASHNLSHNQSCTRKSHLS